MLFWTNIRRSLNAEIFQNSRVFSHWPCRVAMCCEEEYTREKSTLLLHLSYVLFRKLPKYINALIHYISFPERLFLEECSSRQTWKSKHTLTLERSLHSEATQAWVRESERGCMNLLWSVYLHRWTFSSSGRPDIHFSCVPHIVALSHR